MNRELWDQYRDYVEANSPEGFMTYVEWLETLSGQLQEIIDRFDGSIIEEDA